MATVSCFKDLFFPWEFRKQFGMLIVGFKEILSWVTLFIKKLLRGGSVSLMGYVLRGTLQISPEHDVFWVHIV